MKVPDIKKIIYNTQLVLPILPMLELKFSTVKRFIVLSPDEWKKLQESDKVN
jgi:hypothetical protein